MENTRRRSSRCVRVFKRNLAKKSKKKKEKKNLRVYEYVYTYYYIVYTHCRVRVVFIRIRDYDAFGVVNISNFIHDIYTLATSICSKGVGIDDL